MTQHETAWILEKLSLLGADLLAQRQTIQKQTEAIQLLAAKLEGLTNAAIQESETFNILTAAIERLVRELHDAKAAVRKGAAA